MEAEESWGAEAAGEGGRAAWLDHAVGLLGAGERTGDRDLVDDAIWRLERLARLAGDDPNGPGYLSHTGAAWLARYQLTGCGEDLDRSIELHLRAVAVADPVPENQASVLARYARALLARYEATGGDGTLASAIALAGSAAALAGAAYQHKEELPPMLRDEDWLSWSREAAALCQDTLSVALSLLCGRDADATAAGQAVQAGREAVRLTPPGHPSRSQRLADLATALRMSQVVTGDPGALTEAIAMLRRAIELTPAGHARLPGLLRDLGSALGDRLAAQEGRRRRQGIRWRRAAAGPRAAV